MKLNLTPADLAVWRRWEAANRRARLAYAASQNQVICGQPTRAGGTCQRLVSTAGWPCNFHGGKPT